MCKQQSLSFKEWLMTEHYLGIFDDGQNNEVKIYKNSGYNEVVALLSKTPAAQLKGLFVEEDGDVYLWDAWKGIHELVMRSLKNQGIIGLQKNCLKFYIDFDFERLITGVSKLKMKNYDKELIPFKNHPTIKRMLEPVSQQQIA